MVINSLLLPHFILDLSGNQGCARCRQNGTIARRTLTDFKGKRPVLTAKARGRRYARFPIFAGRAVAFAYRPAMFFANANFLPVAQNRIPVLWNFICALPGKGGTHEKPQTMQHFTVYGFRSAVTDSRPANAGRLSAFWHTVTESAWLPYNSAFRAPRPWRRSCAEARRQK